MRRWRFGRKRVVSSGDYAAKQFPPPARHDQPELSWWQGRSCCPNGGRRLRRSSVRSCLGLS